MSTSFFTSVWADIPVNRTRTLISVLRRTACTANFDAWLPWTHAQKFAPRSQRLKWGVQVFVRNEVGLSAGPNAQNPGEVARRFRWAVRGAFPGSDPQIETIALDTAPWVSARIEEGLTDVGDDAARELRDAGLRRKHRTTRGRALMASAISIDRAIRMLTKAKSKIGGDRAVILTLTDGGAYINIHEDEQYAELRLPPRGHEPNRWPAVGHQHATCADTSAAPTRIARAS